VRKRSRFSRVTGEGAGVDDDQGAAQFAGVGNDFGGATPAAGGSAVPDGYQHVAPVYGLHPAVEVGVLAVITFPDYAHGLGLREESLHMAPIVRRKILREGGGARGRSLPS
jgi:hypothetical protein